MLIRSIKDYITYAIQLINFKRINFEIDVANKRAEDISNLNLPKKLKCLDLANGNLRPQFYILQAQGHEVYGVDICNEKKISLVNFLYFICRSIFKIQLKSYYNKTADDINLFSTNVESLPFADNTFDLITSVAAFEHFLNPEAVIKECKRVLKPDGVLWISLHSFTSLSGGHNVHFNLGPVKTMPIGHEPWDHLRKKIMAIKVPLNKLRIHQYHILLEKYFKINNSYCFFSEGKAMLTEEIKRELSDYSEEELLSATYNFVLSN